MPTLELSKKDLEKLAGVKITDESLMLAKAEIESAEGDKLKLEISDTNRPDLWSAEGIAREIKGRFTEIKTSKSGLKVIVDKNLKDIRPKTVCAVIKNVHIYACLIFPTPIPKGRPRLPVLLIFRLRMPTTTPRLGR